MGEESQAKTIVAPSPRLPKLRALVIQAPVEKQAGEEYGESKQVPDEDPWSDLISKGRVISPPFDLFVLTTMTETNSELGPCVDAMEKNIDGFGHRLVARVEAKKAPAGVVERVAAEKVRLKNFFLYAGMKDSFRALRRKTRRDIEATGNGYWEVVRGADGKVQYFKHMRSYQVRLTPLEERSVLVEMPILEIREGGGLAIERIKVRERFRKFVQVSSVIRTRSTQTAGFKKRWFKEFGDPRVYDCETGELVPKKDLADFPEAKRANEVVHWKIYSTRSPYGLPRYIGALLDMFGDRKASEVNYVTFCNNNIPSMVIAVANGQLTQDTVDRVTEFIEKLQGDDNRSKVLVIEAESTGEEGEDSGHIKIDIKPMTSEQIKDALFQNYSRSAREKVRVSYRLPPIFVGRSEDYTRATADTSRRLADEQVFAPERDDFDDWINRILFPEMGVLYHDYKSNSPNTTDNSELVRILAGAEKTGGMTPRRADLILADILGQDLPDFAEDERFNLDLPFSLSMAEAVKNQGDAAEVGQSVTALKRLAGLMGPDTAPADVVKTLLEIRGRFAAALEEEAALEHDEGREEE